VPESRTLVWPFLIGLYPVNSSAAERSTKLDSIGSEYRKLKARWESVMQQDGKLALNSLSLNTIHKSKDKLYHIAVHERKHRVEKDVVRTDRSLWIFGGKNGDSLDANAPTAWPEVKDVEAHPGLKILRDVLLTYAVGSRFDLGYVQGMSDLCTVALVVCLGDSVQRQVDPQDGSASSEAGCDNLPEDLEVATFAVFSHLMTYFGNNFHRDQQSMRLQLELLKRIIALLDPELWSALDRKSSTNCFWAFRWLLVWWKREIGVDGLQYARSESPELSDLGEANKGINGKGKELHSRGGENKPSDTTASLFVFDDLCRLWEAVIAANRLADLQEFADAKRVPPSLQSGHQPVSQSNWKAETTLTVHADCAYQQHQHVVTSSRDDKKQLLETRYQVGSKFWHLFFAVAILESPPVRHALVADADEGGVDGFDGVLKVSGG
jgi:hypothetical protein